MLDHRLRMVDSPSSNHLLFVLPSLFKNILNKLFIFSRNLLGKILFLYLLVALC